MALSNQELCYKCAEVGSTPLNMQEFIIPEMNKRNQDLKYIIKYMHQDRQLVQECKNEIVTNIKAIRVFYSRFPEFKRNWSCAR